MLSKKQQKALVMLFDGRMNQKEIATELKLTEQTIINWKKSDEFKVAYREMSDNLVHDLLPKLLKNQLKNAFSSTSENVKYQATKDLLDRAGFLQQKTENERSDAMRASEKFDDISKELARSRLDSETGAGAE